WRLAGILGVDDGLGVREIGDGVERRMEDCVKPGDDHEHGCDQDKRQITSGCRDQPFDHGAAPVALKDLSADLRLLSASIRKLAVVTTASPSVTPSRTST